MKSLLEISKKFVGTKFILCSNEGMDCFRLCIEYLKMKGAKIPDSTTYKGFNIFDYKSMYEIDPFKTMKLAEEFIASLTIEVKIGFEIAGDILKMKTKKIKNDLPSHFGIEAGNNQVIIAVIDDKIKVVNKNLFKVERVFRWAQE